MGIKYGSLSDNIPEPLTQTELAGPKIEKETLKLISEQESKITHLQEQLREVIERRKVQIHNFYDKQVKIGIISDTHIGSLYARQDILNSAYEIFEKEGVGSVYHVGDLIEGEKMFRGQEYEIHLHGADAQVKEVVNKYPVSKKFKTYFITGSHDLSFFKHAGIDIGERVSNEREDLVYIGREEADIQLGKDERVVKLRLIHPGGGTSYALSYFPQRYIEALSGGQKPEIVAFGHFHKSELLPNYRNIFGVQAGTIQSQTPFMTRKKLAAHLGFWILEFTINKPKLVSRFKSEFFAFFEEKSVFQT